MQTISGARYLSIRQSTAVRRGPHIMSQDADEEHLLYTHPMGIDANQILNRWIRRGFPAFVPLNGGSRTRQRGIRLQANPSLATKAPIYPAIAPPHTGHVTTQLLLQGWGPRHELEAKPVVDHREAA